ncbi:MAG: NAD(P)-dependent oxidoreductase [Bacteroidales bacterium]|nr:NAD(P)-dependent oxidoreductase [Bacteroidales bacterium]
MKVLLTGGTGFIGSHVLMNLLNAGHQVTVLARNINKVPAFHKLKNLKLLQIGMNDFEQIPSVLQGQEAIIHIALSMKGSSAYEVLMSDTAATVFLATEAAKAGIKKFIYTSSTASVDSVYASSNPVCITPGDKLVTINCRHDPCSYYGATKAATEDFLFAIEGETGMKVNIIRPGYTFGNPVVPGAFTQPDNRFGEIVQKALRNEDIHIIKNDGTQFIWADDIAKVYSKVLESNSSKKTYFALAKEFLSWEQIAHDAVKVCNSTSKIIVEDLGWSDTPLLFDVSNIKQDFDLEFSSYPHIISHLEYFKDSFSKQL